MAFSEQKVRLRFDQNIETFKFSVIYTYVESFAKIDFDNNQISL